MPIEVVEQRTAICDWCGHQEEYAGPLIQLGLPKWSYGALCYQVGYDGRARPQVLCPDCGSIQKLVSNPSTTLGRELRAGIHKLIETYTTTQKAHHD